MKYFKHNLFICIFYSMCTATFAQHAGEIIYRPSVSIKPVVEESYDDFETKFIEKERKTNKNLVGKDSIYERKMLRHKVYEEYRKETGKFKHEGEAVVDVRFIITDLNLVKSITIRFTDNLKNKNVYTANYMINKNGEQYMFKGKGKEYPVKYNMGKFIFTVPVSVAEQFYWCIIEGKDSDNKPLNTLEYRCDYVKIIEEEE